MVKLNIEGRVDATNAGEFQTAVLNAFQKGTNVIIDMKDLVYISSAGLRALLIGQKTAKSKNGSQKLINVCPLVKNIFKMTGFADVLIIE